jgi:hypothetical protein
MRVKGRIKTRMSLDRSKAMMTQNRRDRNKTIKSRDRMKMIVK